MHRLAATLLAALAATASAAETLGPEAFDALTRGRTAIYSLDGAFHGMERHYGDRRVEWSFADGACFSGRWYAEGETICFVYENLEGPQCWQFSEAPGGFSATFVDGEGTGATYGARLTDAPLVCTGPQVGA